MPFAHSFDPTSLREYDIRGIVGQTLTTADAEAVGRLADGVVVGSAFVRVIEKYTGTPELETKLEELTRELKTGALQGRAK